METMQGTVPAEEVAVLSERARMQAMGAVYGALDRPPPADSERLASLDMLVPSAISDLRRAAALLPIAVSIIEERLGLEERSIEDRRPPA